jgi:hypothetical protein
LFIDSVKRFGILLGIAVAVAVLGGAGYALVRGKSVEGSVTGSLFVVGAAVFVGGAVTGGGARGARQRGGEPAETSFTGVLIGLVLIALGVLTVVL